MKTQINFSPKLGIFQVNFTLNSWEIPNRSFSLNKDCSLNRLLVDGEESSIIPKRMGNLEVYDLPMGHRYELQYQLRLPMEKQWFFIEDDFHRDMLESQHTGLSYYFYTVAKMYSLKNSK